MLKFATLSAAVLLAIAPAFADDAGRILAANKAASGGRAWDGKQTLKMDYAYSGEGLTGSVQLLEDLRNGRFVDSYSIGPEVYSSGDDGSRPWEKEPSGTTSYQEGGDTPVLSVNEGYRDSNAWWRTDRGGAAIAFAGEKTDNGATYDVLTVSPKGGKPFDAWFDAKTHLLARTIEIQGSQTITTYFSDYRTVDGIRLAGKEVIQDESGAKYAQALTFIDAHFLPAQDPSAYAMPKVQVTDYAIAGGAAQTTIPFRLMNNHIYVDVMVNGKGPFLFLFDTGGRNNLTPETAKAIGFKAVGQMEGNGVGAATVDSGTGRIDSLKVGDATLTNELIGVLDFEQKTTAGFTVEGMVGFQVFRRFVTRIDYGTHTITLIDQKRFDPKDAGVAVPLMFDGHIPVVEGTFEGIPGKFDVDTGSRFELILTKPFAEAQNLRATHPRGSDAIEAWGVGGPSRAFITVGKSMTMGPVRVDNVITSFSTDTRGAFNDESYQGNIGGALLKRFVVTFDYEHQTMYLKRLPEPVADTGVFDRSGMWINQADDSFKVVDVTKGAPADAAGLKVGDEIVAVDGQPAKSVVLSDLRQRLRDEAPGTAVTFTIKSGSSTKNVKVTLRDLI